MPSWDRKLRNRLKSGAHSLFVAGQKFGWDILPRHFYSSIPDIAELRSEEAWRTPSSLVGVNGADVACQMHFVRECCPSALQERLRQGGIHAYACHENGEPGYGAVEADFLFCFIASKRPKRIVQVGCGVSTAVILLAAKESAYRPQITCIEPFPTAYLKRLAESKWIDLVPAKAQHVDLALFSDLDAGDLLFIDSTHAVRPGSEVNRLILEVLPRVNPGCFVHFHDIYFPYDYQSTVLTTLFFAGESTLLHAFLINNARYWIAACFSMLHHACRQEMQAIFPHYRPAPMHNGLHLEPGGSGHFPSSIYLVVH
ncbi:MAG: class I SAM-dependent methyltransferase [Acidobacteriia bacterium]|nr:class I SAM-dependent methyltransferase [Terriglobia bacterium]